ncbi:hypothetical protein AGMMS49949_05410 [Alphaproteobacteria bacterium]|nr:hypothetical protein AGMMS49949_05410 [Alphaproteobacteria bacterium]GHS97515.1 hypothetical protein AGMMS50296_4580 [Alphaproteobacteria bacterium]
MSLPKSQFVDSSSVFRVDLKDLPFLDAQADVSAIMGIPMLVQNRKITPLVKNTKTSFTPFLTLERPSA